MVVSLSMAEIKTIAVAIAEPFGKALVEEIFGPMIVPGSVKRVKK